MHASSALRNCVFPPAGCVSQPGHWWCCLCFWALCLPALRHPSTLLLLRASESLECFPSRGLSCRLRLSDQKGRLNSSVHKKTLQFPEESWDLGSLLPVYPPKSLPGAQLWRALLPPFHCSRAKSLTLTSVPLGQLCGSGNSPWLFGPLTGPPRSGTLSVTATNICVAICKPCP